MCPTHPINWLLIQLIVAGALGCAEPRSATNDGGPEAGSGAQVRLSIPRSIELCANGHFSTTAPDSFRHNARLSLPAQEHELGPSRGWDSELGAPAGGVDAGVSIDLGATLSFPHVSEEVQTFGAGSFVPVADRDAFGASAPGLAWLFSTEYPTSTTGPLTGAFLRFEPAAVLDSSDTFAVTVPNSTVSIDRFHVVTGCTSGPEQECSIGPHARPQGVGIFFGPCAPIAVESLEAKIETERGNFRFEFSFATRSAPSSLGWALFAGASGEFDGVPFEQTDPMELSMAAGGRSRSGIGESFGVLFDEPIGEVCGLVVENLIFEPQTRFDPLGRIGYEIDCNLERGEPFLVQSGGALESG